jgi:hypothetical protein
MQGKIPAALPATKQRLSIHSYPLKYRNLVSAIFRLSDGLTNTPVALEQISQDPDLQASRSQLAAQLKNASDDGVIQYFLKNDQVWWKHEILGIQIQMRLCPMHLCPMHLCPMHLCPMHLCPMHPSYVRFMPSIHMNLRRRTPTHPRTIALLVNPRA